MKKINYLEMSSNNYSTLEYEKIFLTELNGNLILIDFSPENLCNLFLECKLVKIFLSSKEVKEINNISYVYFSKKSLNFCILVS